MFRFRLQQVLDLRERAERSLASQLANAVGAEQDAQRTLNDLQAARDAGTEGSAGATRSVGELANLAFIIQQIDGQIATASDAVMDAGATVSEAKQALTGALQDRRVLDRLRDRHQETYRAASDQLDRRNMDDIALSRYVQSEDQ